MEHLQVSELQQYLFVFDGISELPTSVSLLQLMSNRYTHCIMLYSHHQPPDIMMRAIDHKLLRGCKVYHLESLSMISSTQRIVYSVQKEIHFCPNSNDQAIIQKISNFTSGSPVLVDIISKLLPSYLSNTCQQSPQEGLKHFANDISLYVTRENRSPHSDSPTSSLTSSNGSSLSSGRELFSSVSDSISSISILSPDCRDEWDTPCSYDSWDSIAELLYACHFDAEAMLLLNCLSCLGCSPIPIDIVTSLSSLIAKTTGKNHLASSLLTQLKDKGFVKLYPSPVVIHKSLKSPSASEEFVYVPKFMSDYLTKEVEFSDKAMALAVCFHIFSHFTSPFSGITVGLFKTLIMMYELNSDLMGDFCYKEVYRFYLSLIN